MIRIKREIVDQLVAYSRELLPNEACGYLAGNNRIATTLYELTNTDHSPEHFTLDPMEQFKAIKSARNAGLEIIAMFHSHPETLARPSLEDIRLAYDPMISYVIVSLQDSNADIKSFRIRDGVVEHEDIIIL